jgi:hypothetical protein
MPNGKDSETDPTRKRGTDTSSYEQPQGGHDPNRRSEKLPHERDESARSTGNRLDQKVPPSKRQISQAEDDIEAGRVDTDRRGVPNDVPSGKR